jgi:large subunit ribosomal protein L14
MRGRPQGVYGDERDKNKKMITLLTKVQIIDNSGGLVGRCIKILSPKDHKVAKLGDVVLITILKTSINTSGNSMKRGDIYKALVVRSASKNSHISKFKTSYSPVFNSSAVVLIKVTPKGGYEPIGSRIKGPIPSVLTLYKNSHLYQKVLSISRQFI